MTSAEIEEKIQSILWGKALADIEDESGKTHHVIIRALNSKENNIVNYLYNKEMTDCKKSGICTDEELTKIYQKNDTWTQEEEDEILKLQNGIRKLKNVLPEYKFRKAKLASIKKRIKRAEKDLIELLNTRSLLFGNSLENRANEARTRKVIQLCLETMEETPFWTQEEFNSFVDIMFIQAVMRAYTDIFIFPVAITREIVRSSMWRYRWKAAKDGANLFGKPVSEWSEAQNSAVFWSQYYDWIFEHPDCPMGLVNNDEAIDKWVEDESRKQKSENVLSKRGNNSNPNATTETFVMVDKGDKETISEVQSFNDDSTRRRLRTEQGKIKEKGEVTEWELRKNLHKANSLKKDS